MLITGVFCLNFVFLKTSKTEKIILWEKLNIGASGSVKIKWLYRCDMLFSLIKLHGGEKEHVYYIYEIKSFFEQIVVEGCYLNPLKLTVAIRVQL